jgi:hypothetical protein
VACPQPPFGSDCSGLSATTRRTWETGLARRQLCSIHEEGLQNGEHKSHRLCGVCMPAIGRTRFNLVQRICRLRYVTIRKTCSSCMYDLLLLFVIIRNGSTWETCPVRPRQRLKENGQRVHGLKPAVSAAFVMKPCSQDEVCIR